MKIKTKNIKRLIIIAKINYKRSFQINATTV